MARLKSGITPAEAAALRGRLLNAEQQSLGRKAVRATRAKGKRAWRAGGVASLADDLEEALKWIVEYLEHP